MTDLSDEARALFDAARPAHEPSDVDQRRVFRAVLQTSALAASTLGASASAAAVGGASAAAGGTAASTATATGLGLGAKLLFGGILVGSASVGLYHVARPSQASASAVSALSVAAAAPRVNDATRPATPPAPLAPESDPALAVVASAPSRVDDAPAALDPGRLAATPTARDATPLTARRDEPAAAETPLVAKSAIAAFPTDQPASSSASALTEEARALANVQRALREGNGNQALALLDAQDVKFHAGELGPERAAARIVALCAVGRVAEARSAGARFLAASPHSPLAARVRATCAAP
ncbi:MAG TPA: hypothetical protein VGI10_21620 [Polyangiaceae bacterium]|jgi:hypothetical protein